MKKLLLSLIGFLIAITPVFAAENKLYFTESGDRLLYSGSLLDDNIFMKHLDMTPGSSYTDELIIENGTSTTYKLFFKVIEKSDVSHDLLDYIDMKIYLDDVLIYDGKVKGLDYNNDGVNLQNAIELGDFPGRRKAVMKVETSLSTDYSNQEDNDLSEVDWQFYAEYYEEEEPTPEPKDDPKPTIKPIERDVPKKTPGKVQTGMLTNVAIYSVAIGVSLLILFVILYLKRYNNKEMK